MSKNVYLYLIAIIAMSLLTIETKIYNSIKGLPNLKEGFTQFDLGLPENTLPLYYIDVNNDGYIDIIASCQDGETSNLCYYIYNIDSKTFNQPKNSQMLKSLSFERRKIINCIANDLNDDSYIDLVLTLQDNDTKHLSTQIYLYNQISQSFDMEYEIDNSIESLFFGDLGDERGMNIMFYKDGTRKFLSFDKNTRVAKENEFTSILSKNLDLCNANEKYVHYEIDSVNSNGFVDIDGDCLNDILIQSIDKATNQRYLEIWKAVIEDNKIKYCLNNNNIYPLENSLGLFSIVDIDRNAMPDLVFPIIGSSPPKILIMYNKLPIKYDWTENYCDHHSPIKVSSSTDINNSIPSVFDPIQINSNNNNFISVVTIYNDSNMSFYQSDDIPLYLRFIDIDQDSYPDFITVLHNKYTNTQSPFVFLSQEILYDSNYKGIYKRNFSKERIYEFNVISNGIIATFFDFEEIAKLGLIVITSNRKAYGFWNHNVYDSYSLKSYLLFKSHCYYCNEIGSTQRFITTNIDGTRRMDLSIQSGQPSVKYGLSLPFAYLGIGRSNNYIENFHIISGTNEKRSNNDKVYTPVIPNSQLVVYHDTKANSTTLIWKVNLLVKPTENLRLLITVIVLMIVIMTMIVLKLQMKEHEEDSIENKETFAPWFG